MGRRGATRLTEPELGGPQGPVIWICVQPQQDGGRARRPSRVRTPLRAYRGHSTPRGRAFRRTAAISQLIAAFALWLMPLAHALQAVPAAPAAPAAQAQDVHPHHPPTGHYAHHGHHGDLSAQAPAEAHGGHDEDGHTLHRLMQCDCLLCKLLNAAALPAAAAPAPTATTAAPLRAAARWTPHTARTLRPPERGPPAVLI